MTAAQINRAVSQVTGESIREIRHLGFQIADSPPCDRDSEADDQPPQIVDWDELDCQRQRNW